MLACEQDRPDVARRRRWWHRLQPRLAPERLVFIDETWTKTNMTRTHGWWRRGEPLKAKVPHGHWRTTTFLAALRNDAITAPLVLDGPINGETFRAYVEQVLIPTLEPGDIRRDGQPRLAQGRRGAALPPPSATCAVSHSGTAPIITINSGFELNWPNSVLERAGNQPLALILKECTS